MHQKVTKLYHQLFAARRVVCTIYPPVQPHRSNHFSAQQVKEVNVHPSRVLNQLPSAKTANLGLTVHVMYRVAKFPS